MSALTTGKDEILEALVVHGDVSRLSPGQKSAYVLRICESLGLNPMTKPFEFVKFQGKEILYARKDCTDQLRKLHGVSVIKLEREQIGDLIHVTAYGEDRHGKKDVGTGVLSISGLKGEALANAYMKCETKAKRRLTLSICGLGMLDELEVETIPGARIAKDNARAEKAQALIQSSPQEPDLEIEAEAYEEPIAPPQESLADYVIKAGKNKGKRLGDMSERDLNWFIDWANSQDRLHKDVAEYRDKAAEYLQSKEPARG